MSARAQGLILATVTDVDDPEGLGRVKVSYDERPGAPPSNWAPIVRPFASDGFGMWFMPEVGDKVVVGFLHGNLESPYMLGAIFSGAHAPPVTEPQQRVIQTRAGHQIILDDTDGSETVTILDANQNSLVMDADGITITSQGKVTIEANEVAVTGTQSVDIESSGQLTGKGNPIHLNP
jgi:phage baseplate assembly protein V